MCGIKKTFERGYSEKTAVSEKLIRESYGYFEIFMGGVDLVMGASAIFVGRGYLGSGAKPRRNFSKVNFRSFPPPPARGKCHKSTPYHGNFLSVKF